VETYTETTTEISTEITTVDNSGEIENGTQDGLSAKEEEYAAVVHILSNEIKAEGLREPFLTEIAERLTEDLAWDWADFLNQKGLGPGFLVKQFRSGVTDPRAMGWRPNPLTFHMPVAFAKDYS
jgi:hypothetical protein